VTGLSIVEYNDDLATAFHDINAEWIAAMFVLEDHDRYVLTHPREAILDCGGTILFVALDGVIVGTCALMKTADGVFELTKMGVTAAARGAKAGEFLLAAMIARAAADPAVEVLYLLTNSACEPAIHLYEKAGFVHDATIMAQYGATYARCDVAMRYRLPNLPGCLPVIPA